MAQQKSYKDQLMELYGQGQQTSGTAQTGTGQTQSNAMLDLILARQPFSYDPKTDPAAQAVRKQTARNAHAVTQDTLGQYAGMTGGVPSTAAVSAAAQAGNQATAAGADKIAELKQLAYQNYLQEGTDMQNAYGMLRQQEADAYNRGRDALADERYKEELAYNRGWNEEQRAYDREQDAYNRSWNEGERDYSREQDEYERKYQLALLKAQYGDYSGLKELGIDTSKYTAGGGSQYSYTPKPGDDKQKDPEGGLPTSVSNSLWMSYPSGAIPASEWATLAAQYGESALAAEGFRKAAAQSGGGTTKKNPTLPAKPDENMLN